MVMATSPRNAFAGSSTTSAPRPASSRAGSGDRFQTRSRCPAESRRDAIARPMAPSPRKPTSISLLHPFAGGSARRAGLVATGQQPLGEIESLLELTHAALQALDGGALRFDVAAQTVILGPRRRAVPVPASPQKDEGDEQQRYQPEHKGEAPHCAFLPAARRSRFARPVRCPQPPSAGFPRRA